jgi:post-segregation antitoxin (ccd killing protein)
MLHVRTSTRLNCNKFACLLHGMHSLSTGHYIMRWSCHVSGCSRCIIMSRLEAPAARMLCAKPASQPASAGRRRLITARGGGENRARGLSVHYSRALHSALTNAARQGCTRAWTARAAAALDCCANRIACAIVVPVVARSSARSPRACVRALLAALLLMHIWSVRTGGGGNSAFECTCVRAWESTGCLCLTSNSNPKLTLKVTWNMSL